MRVSKLVIWDNPNTFQRETVLDGVVVRHLSALVCCSSKHLREYHEAGIFAAGFGLWQDGVVHECIYAPARAVAAFA